jgi:glycosyltransferase involved in cell wall biosynthesis
MNNCIISIIIPIYNSEFYLRKCLDSILEQTFTDFECILINDGSTDKSPVICDEYVKKDARFIVIHQINKGVSAARNAGLDIARGEWIGFVDSDDWCDPDMYEFLYKNALNNHADISICKFRKIRNDSFINISKNIDKNNVNVLLDKNEALFNLFSNKGYFKGYLMTKLFKKSLFHNNNRYINFNEEITFCEDELILFFLIKNANKIIFSHNVLYNYLQHDNSAIGLVKLKGITTTSTTRYKAYEIMLNIEKNKKIKKLIKLRITKFAIYSSLKYIRLNKLYHDNLYILSCDVVKKYILFILLYSNFKNKIRSIFVIFPCLYLTYLKLREKYE